MVPMNAIQPKIPRGFKAVPGVRGYAVSKLGRVISCWLPGRAKRFSDEWHFRKLVLHKPVDPVKPSYFKVSVRRPGRPKRYEQVHLLVLRTYIGPPPIGTQGCHNNGKSLDNRLTNLRWGTPVSNSADQSRHGTVSRGEDRYNSRLTEKQVRMIRASRESVEELAVRLGVNKRTVRDVLERVTWKHVR